MAIFNKKPEYLFSDPNLKGETLAYFEQKTKILRDSKMKTGVEKAKKDARTMENFLNAIKNRQYKKGDLRFVIEEEFFNQLIENLPQEFFKRQHSKEELEKDFDDIFEKELSDILHKMMADSRTGRFLSGTESGNTITRGDEIERILDYSKIYLLQEMGESVVKKMQGYAGGPKAASIFNFPVAKQQKSDVVVNVDISTQVKPEYQKIMSLFNNNNFSLKNYISGTNKGVSVSLGNTNPLKSIVGTLIDLGATQSVAIKAFYAATSVYAREDNSPMGQELAYHIYMMRSYYELTGAGLMINNEPISKVDFLIVNKPDGIIKVVSTKEIMLDILNNKPINKIGNPFGPIHYTINY